MEENNFVLTEEDLAEINIPQIKKEIEGLKSLLKEVKDPRDKRGKKYPLYYVLALYLIAGLAGKNDCVNICFFIEQNIDFFSAFIPEIKELGIPSHDCFTNCLADLPEESLRELLKKAGGLFYDWEKDRLGVREEKKWFWEKKEGIIWRGEKAYKKVEAKNYLLRHLAVDGKASRGARDKKGGANTPYTAGLVDPVEHVFLDLVNIPNGKNEGEATMVRQMLKESNLTGSIITADALHSSTETMETVINSGGEFLFKIKQGSHPKQYELVKELLEDQKQKQAAFEKRKESAQKVGETVKPDPDLTLEVSSKTEKYNGKLRKYYIQTCADLDGLFADYCPYICQVACVKVETYELIYDKESGELIEERLESEYECALLISTRLPAEAALRIYINHWGIETSHWFLDLFLKEDRSTARKGHQIYNRAAMLRLCLNLIRLLDECVQETKGLSMSQKFTFLQSWCFVAIMMVLGYQQDYYLKLALVYRRREKKCLFLHEEAKKDKTSKVML